MQLRRLPSAFLLTSVIVISAHSAPTSCPSNYFDGQAPNVVNRNMSRESQELCFSEYAVRHSGLTRTPLYSAEHLTSGRVERAGLLRRADASDTFHEEQRLPVGDRSRLGDYARSGFDRGHMSPSGDFSTRTAQAESFSLANMIPQDPDNNRNLWEGIEYATRRMASQYGEVWVVTLQCSWDELSGHLRG